MAHIPFKDRLWCSVDETCQVTGQGRTAVFAKMSSGEIVSKLEGRRRLIHVPSLIASYDIFSPRNADTKPVDDADARGAGKTAK